MSDVAALPCTTGSANSYGYSSMLQMPQKPRDTLVNAEIPILLGDKKVDPHNVSPVVSVRYQQFLLVLVIDIDLHHRDKLRFLQAINLICMFI